MTLTPTNDAGILGGELLSFVLLGKGQSTDLDQVLEAFAELHMIKPSNGLAPSRTVVMIGSGSLPSGDRGGAMELALVNGFAKNGGRIVVAAEPKSATRSGLVALLRRAGSPTVSTVDNADTSMGQVAVVLATVQALNSKVGQYGTGPGAQQLYP